MQSFLVSVFQGRFKRRCSLFAGSVKVQQLHYTAQDRGIANRPYHIFFGSGSGTMLYSWGEP